MTVTETNLWTCSGCGKLFTAEAQTPTCRFISVEHPRVCSPCWDMYHVLIANGKLYWKLVQSEADWQKKQDEDRRKGNL